MRLTGNRRLHRVDGARRGRDLHRPGALRPDDRRPEVRRGQHRLRLAWCRGRAHRHGRRHAAVARPRSLSFGGRDIDNGPTAAQTSVVSNSGTEQIDFSAVTLTGTDARTSSTSPAPRRLRRHDDPPAHAELRVRARFDPTSTGAKSAAVQIDSTAADLSIGLSGSGQPDPALARARHARVRRPGHRRRRAPRSSRRSPTRAPRRSRSPASTRPAMPTSRA